MARSDHPSARPFLPDKRNLKSLAEAAEGCQGCPLYKGATQVVFGEGPRDARLLLVGEAPGQQEDKSGRPFAGPAGEALDRALEEAGLDRATLYITNAVKHFKSENVDGEIRGLKPRVSEINACNPWLQAEIEEIQPRIVIALGTVAARGLVGRAITIGEAREQWMQTKWGQPLIVSFHPSASIQAPFQERRDRIFDALVYDLERARDALNEPRPQPGA